MICVTCPIKQDFIIALLDGVTLEDISFVFKEKQGMKLIFNHNGEDQDKAIRLVKQHIKSTEIGNVLYFQVN